MKKKVKDLYSILGVGRTATADEIKAAYRKKAKACHPDRNPGDEKAEAKFKEVTLAYEVLFDPVRRTHYDKTGEVGPAHDRQAEKLIPLLHECLMTVIKQACAQGHQDLKRINLAAKVRDKIQDEIREAKKTLKSILDSRKVLETAVGRFTSHDGKENLLEAVLGAELRGNLEEEKRFQEMIAFFGEAAEFVKTYGYKTDGKINDIDARWEMFALPGWRPL